MISLYLIQAITVIVLASLGYTQFITDQKEKEKTINLNNLIQYSAETWVVWTSARWSTEKNPHAKVWLGDGTVCYKRPFNISKLYTITRKVGTVAEYNHLTGNWVWQVTHD
jgi:hypothetical protein